MKAGVLALQGDVREHAAMFAEAGATPVLVRTPDELAEVDVLAIPGGESTTISKLAWLHGLVEPVRERAGHGMPVLGTCAGLIVMAQRVEGGEPLLGILDVTAVRNVYVDDSVFDQQFFHPHWPANQEHKRYEAQVGNIGINVGVAAPIAYFPFSGWKDSFFGDLHAQGRDAVDFYTEKKVVVERWPKEWSRVF